MMQQRGGWRVAAASRAAVVSVLLLALAGVVGLVSGAGVIPGPLVQEGSFVRSKWIFKREFFFKRDQARSGMDHVAMRDNRLAKFANSGEVGYWKVERRSTPGAGAKRKFSRVGGMDVLILDVPEQGDNKDLIVSYEIPVTKGRYHPTSIQFAGEGSIFVAGSKEELVGTAAAARKKIGTFSVDLKTLPPMIDRTFTA